MPVLLGAFFAIGVTNAQGATNSEDGCVDQALSHLFREHRFVELEPALKDRLRQSLTTDDMERRACLRALLGGVQGRLEKYAESLANLREALGDASMRNPPDHPMVLEIRMSLAATLGKSGDRAAEIGTYKELLPLYEKRFAPYSANTATLLRNLATAYAWVGNYPEAVRTDRQVLKIQSRLAQTSVAEYWRRNQIPAVADAEMHLAESLIRVPGSSQEALQLAEKALPAIKAMRGPDHPDVLNAQLVLAYARAAAGDAVAGLSLTQATFDVAQRTLGDAHPVTRKARNDLAVALSGTGDAATSIELDRKNLGVLTASKGLAHPETVFAHANLSSKLVKAGRHDETIAVTRAGLHGAMALRRTIDFDARIVAAWQGRTRNMVENLLYALASTKRTTDVFLVAEHFKSRMLADRLVMDAGEMRLPDVDRKRYRMALLKLADIEQDLAVRRSLNMPTSGLESQRLQAAKSINSVSNQTEGPTPPEEIPNSQSIPAWAGMARILSEEKTAYVSFVRIHGHLFATSFTSAGQMLFAPIAPLAKLRPLIAATHHLMLPPTLRRGSPIRVWRAGTGQIHLGARTNDDETEVRNPDTLLDELGKLIWDRLAPALAGRKNIVISSDDVMAHAPFSAMPLNGRPLVESYAVSVVPSLEVLLRIRTRSHQRTGNELRPVLAIGGARYQRIEEYAPGIYIQHEKASPELMDLKLIRQTLAGDPKRLPMALATLAYGFSNLPGSDAEARFVYKTLGGAASNSRLLTDSLATEASWNELSASGELGKYRVIHLAAHGFLSDDDPALSAVVLGQRKREPGTDGFLTSAELSAVELNSDLVVVSACNSGVSGYVEGEGMLGLAFALFEAGSRHALLTLWPISDKYTVEFMEHFYDSYRTGTSPTQALATAQRWAVAQGWPTRDWAAFVLHGN